MGRTLAMLPAALSIALAGCGNGIPAAPTPAVHPGWQTPVRLGPTAGSTTLSPTPTIASDAEGRAIAAWVDYAPTVDGGLYGRADVRAARFEPAGQWRAPVLLGDACCGVVYADVVMNLAGDAAVVWSRPSVSFFSPGAGWGPALLPPMPGAEDIGVALAEDGAAVAIWQGDDPAVTGGAWYDRQRLWGARLSREGWGVPQIISASEAPDYQPRALGVDRQGNAMAMWVESGPPSLHHEPAALWTNRFVRASGWGTRERLAALPNVTGWGGTPMTFDMHPDGHVAALWLGPGGLEASVYGAEGWTRPTIVGEARVAYPHVRMLPEGRAIAVWPSYDRGLEAITFEEGRGWSAAEPLDGRPFPLAGYPGADLDLGVDGSGGAVVVWSQDERVRVARFSASGGWERPVTLQNTAAPGHSARIAVSPGGEAFAVWAERLPMYAGDEIWAAVYVPDRR